jgi:L-ascorbate metabolism protein UlaG (beta-lactamase superfamily)
MATSVRWLGHAAFEIASPKGKTVLIDPWILDNPACPLKLDEINKGDIVLVTHDHFDHVGNAADIVKKTKGTLIAPVETARRLKEECGIADDNVVFFGMGMNIGGSVNLEGITVTMTQAFHSTQTATPAGYIIQLEDGTTIYHAGDTGIFDSMRLLGEMYGIDLAMLPIGSVFTMDPFQAAKALALLKPKKAMPMHYKSFPILEQSADRFVKLAKKEAPGVEVVVLKPGQQYSL